MTQGRGTGYIRALKPIRRPVNILTAGISLKTNAVPEDTTGTDILHSYAILAARRNWRDVHGKAYPTAYASGTAISGFAEDLDAIARHKRNRYMVWARDAGRLAQCVQLDMQLRKLGWSPRHWVEKPGLCIAVWTRDTTTITLLDIANIWRSHIQTLADRYEGRAKNTVWDGRLGERDIDAAMEDALGSWFMLSAFESVTERMGGCGHGLTLASCSLNYFRSHHLPERTLCPTTNPEVVAQERRALYGGRTQVLHAGRHTGDIQMLDFNAMYPHIMATNSLPVRYRFSESVNSWPKIDPDSTLKPALVELVGIQNTPILPVRKNHRIRWLQGPVGGIYPYVEAVRALSLGLDAQPVKLHWYSHALVFQAWARSLWDLRRTYERQALHAETLMVKLMMNALWGKFAQRSTEWLDMGPTNRPEGSESIGGDMDTGETWFERVRLGRLFREIPRDELRYSMPAMAAVITGLGRMRCHDLILRASPDRALYVDTDCIVIQGRPALGLRALIKPDAFGCLKTQWRTNLFDVAGPKMYRTDKALVIPGMSVPLEDGLKDTMHRRVYLSWDAHMKHGYTEGLHWRNEEVSNPFFRL